MTDELPETKQINDQVAVRCESSNPDYPGFIYVPRELSPDQFHKWWLSVNDKRPDISPEQAVYQDRHHLVLEWHIQGIRPDHVSPEGDKFPSVWFWGFVTAATELQLEAAQNLPFLQNNWIDVISGSQED